MLHNRKKHKVFCIGRNKTGTTTIEQVLKSFGYKLGDQGQAELFTNDWKYRNFKNVIKFCKKYDAFQDVPFSHDFTFQAIDTAFPNSKFILTIRNNANEWFDSLTRFHTKIVNKGRLPTAEDLKEFPYRHKGWLWNQFTSVYGDDESILYDRHTYTTHYNNHNNRIREYFRHRPQDLLVINIADPTSMEDLCDFLGFDFTDQEMPHLNQSN